MEEVIHSRQGRQKLKAEPSDIQKKESIQVITFGGRPVKGAIQRRQGMQKLKKEPPLQPREGVNPGNPVWGQTSEGSHPEQAALAATEGRAT